MPVIICVSELPERHRREHECLARGVLWSPCDHDLRTGQELERESHLFLSSSCGVPVSAAPRLDRFGPHLLIAFSLLWLRHFPISSTVKWRSRTSLTSGLSGPDDDGLPPLFISRIASRASIASLLVNWRPHASSFRNRNRPSW